MALVEDFDPMACVVNGGTKFRYQIVKIVNCDGNVKERDEMVVFRDKQWKFCCVCLIYNNFHKYTSD